MSMPARKIAFGLVAACSLVSMTPGAAQAQYGGRWMGGGWYGGGWHGGSWVGPALAGAVGGLALGALAGSAYRYYGYGPLYPGCYWQNRPAYDPWGRFVGYLPVQVCY